MVAEKDTFSFCVSGIAFGFAFWIRAFPLSHSDLPFGFARSYYRIRICLLDSHVPTIAFGFALLDSRVPFVAFGFACCILDSLVG